MSKTCKKQVAEDIVVNVLAASHCDHTSCDPVQNGCGLPYWKPNELSMNLAKHNQTWGTASAPSDTSTPVRKYVCGIVCPGIVIIFK